MFTIRKATPEDTPVIFDLIKKLAVYEKMENDVITSTEELKKNIFGNNFANLFLVATNKNPVNKLYDKPIVI